MLPVYSYPYQEGDNSSTTLFNPLLGEKPKEQAVVVGKNNGYTLPEIKSYQAEEVYPGDFANTQFYRFKTNPETPLRAYRVNEFGTPIPNEDGVIQEVLNSKGEPIQLPRSAQIANKAEFISQPRLMVQDFKGTTPDYQPIPDGMSYEEADRKGLLNPIFNARTVGLNSSYQIPLSKGVGLARVLDSSDSREQAAFAAQATRRQIPSLVQQGQSILADSSFTPEEKSTKVKELFAHPLEILGSDEVDALIKIAKKENLDLHLTGSTLLPPAEPQVLRVHSMHNTQI